MGGQRVGLGGVNGLAVHLHVLYPALAVHLHELLLVVEHHRGGNRGVDGIGQAGDLQEPAVLLRRHTRAHLQRVQNVLARGLHHAGLVAEGMHVDDLLIGDLPRGDVGPHAPAVDKGHVGVQHHPVGVRAQVAQIGLGAAHRALPGGRVLGGQVHVGLGHDLLQHPGKLVVDALHEGPSGLVLSGAVLGRHQLAGDLARLGVDDHLAQVGQLGARLGHQHVLPGLVLLGLGKGAVGVPVDQHVDAGGVGNHLGGGPGGALLVHAQVPQRHHVVGALCLGRVYRLLHHVIQVLALVALAEAVDIVPRGVLEIGRGGLGEGLRRIDAHVADLHVAVGQHLIAVQHRLPLQVGEVGAQIGILRLLPRQGQEVVHAVVKLVVARNGQIVAHLVHDLHDVRALGQRPDGAALDGVAGIHQRHVLRAVGRLHGGLIRGHARIADVGHLPCVVLGLINAAVYVVGVQDYDLAALRACGVALCRHGRYGQAERHGHSQQQRQHLLLLHFSFPPFVPFLGSSKPSLDILIVTNR
ncbi:Uncharacterised protein [uncultured Flavonifractor sp.]|nr:Uncharacterised protein [uncultured Flavonifractor sp.]